MDNLLEIGKKTFFLGICINIRQISKIARFIDTFIKIYSGITQNVKKCAIMNFNIEFSHFYSTKAQTFQILVFGTL